MGGVGLNIGDLIDLLIAIEFFGFARELGQSNGRDGDARRPKASFCTRPTGFVDFVGHRRSAESRRHGAYNRVVASRAAPALPHQLIRPDEPSSFAITDPRAATLREETAKLQPSVTSNGGNGLLVCPA